MPAVTTSITAPNNSWVIAATGAENVLLAGPSNGYRFYVGPSSPGGSTDGIPVTSADGTASLSGLGVTNVYVRSLLPTGSADVRVLSV